MSHTGAESELYVYQVGASLQYQSNQNILHAPKCGGGGIHLAQKLQFIAGPLKWQDLDRLVKYRPASHAPDPISPVF